MIYISNLSLEKFLSFYDISLRIQLPPTAGSGDSIRRYVMKKYRAGVREFDVESWDGPSVYQKNDETYVCGYRLFNPYRLISNLRFNTNYGLLAKEYYRLKGGKA